MADKPVFNHPKTGEVIEVPDGKKIVFNAGKPHLNEEDDTVVFEDDPDLGALHPTTNDPIVVPLGKVIRRDQDGMIVLDDKGDVVYNIDPHYPLLHPTKLTVIEVPPGKRIVRDLVGNIEIDDKGEVVFEDDPNAQQQGGQGGPPPPLTPEEERLLKDYKLYLTMCKSLTLQLPFERDRVIASKWVKKIEKSEEEIAKRLNYVKLLCITTLQHRLAGPFKRVPKDGPLDDLGDMTTETLINVMASESVSITTPYYVELSGDLKEYAAYQEIPDFGAHFYYAFSNETILNWHNEKRAFLPKGGLNYPILNPPHRHITQSSKKFKETYATYAQPKPKSIITPDLLPTLVPELHKRKVIMKEEIFRMGTKKLISERCKCAPETKPDLIGTNFLPQSGDPSCSKPRANIGRPASCIARKEACEAAEKAKLAAEKARNDVKTM